MSYGYFEAMRETGTGAFILKIRQHIFTRKFNVYGKAVYTTDMSSGPKVPKTHRSYRESAQIGQILTRHIVAIVLLTCTLVERGMSRRKSLPFHNLIIKK